MARLLIYDNYADRVYSYSDVHENDSMPYSTEQTLLVRGVPGGCRAATSSGPPPPPWKPGI